MSVEFSSVREAREAVARVHGREVQGATVWARQLAGEVGCGICQWAARAALHASLHAALMSAPNITCTGRDKERCRWMLAKCGS